MPKGRHKGFTLIELLVVISIIGLLSSVVLANLQATRVKARDTERISELREIRNALELYYADRGYYPASPCGWDCNGYSTSYESSWDTLQTELAPYIGSLPRDPVNSSCGPWGNGCHSYAYGNVGRTVNRAQYDLTAQLEDTASRYRCDVKQYKYYFNDAYNWCSGWGSYSTQIYEASL